MSTIRSKFNLLNSFSNGLSWEDFTVINAIQREDGSNKCYNVTGTLKSGETVTKFYRVD